MADLIVNLHQEGYIIRERDEETDSRNITAVYCLRYKGAVALEEYRRYLWNYYPSLILSTVAVIISLVGLFHGY